MPATRQFRRVAGPRDLLFFSSPHLWPHRPFLPVIRCPVGAPMEYGVLYDAVHVSGIYGFSTTVFLANLLLLPRTEAKLFALPRRVYDAPEEMAADGWVVD